MTDSDKTLREEIVELVADIQANYNEETFIYTNQLLSLRTVGQILQPPTELFA